MPGKLEPERVMTLFFALAACGPSLSTQEVKDTDFDDIADTTPPLVSTEPIAEAQPSGQDIPITATVSDEESAILFVTLYYKTELEASSEYRTFGMTLNGDVWEGRIRGTDQSSGGMDYYIEAIDSSQNAGFAPEEGSRDPYHVRLYDAG